MIGMENGYASIPEITTRNAAAYSHDISLTLLNQIEQTVDSLTNVEHALDGVIHAMRAAENMWTDVEPPVEMPQITSELIELVGDTASKLKRSHELYQRKKQAAYDDHRLRGGDEEMIVTSYERVLNRMPVALEAVESLKWTLMDLQALSESERSKVYTDVEELIADLNS